MEGEAEKIERKKNIQRNRFRSYPVFLRGFMLHKSQAWGRKVLSGNMLQVLSI
jgi:hypothetical protein